MGILHRIRRPASIALWRTEQWLTHRLGFVRTPEAVQWISTSVCDLTCPHCYSHAGRKSREELTTEEVRRHMLDELVALDRPVFVIAGGEPMLRKDFGAIVAEAGRRRIPWALHTHGGHVEKWRDVLRDHPPVMAAVSLDGPKRYHDAFRGKRGSFDAALRAMRLLEECGCKEVVAGTTVTRGNADLLVDLVPVILGSSAHSWGLHLMTPEGRAGANRDQLATPGQLRRVAALARRLRSIMHVELDNEWGSAGRDDPFYRDDFFMCGAGRISCVISATGEVMPCTTTDLSESAGNVRDRRLSRIWAEGFDEFRSADSHADPLKQDCADCWLQTRHGNSCRRSAFTRGVFDPMTSDATQRSASSLRVHLTVGSTS